MSIKKIVICGLKSYGEKVVIDNLDDGLNVVVGKNGSGKSNLFFAVQFALNSEMLAFSAQERRFCLHEGAGEACRKAYVEITLDNSQGFFSGRRSVVKIRRTITQDKDTFYVNGGKISKQALKRELHFAGFSTCSLSIVMQGRMNYIATASPEARLNLLKNMIGITFFEETHGEMVKKIYGAKQQLDLVEKRMKERGGILDTLQRNQEMMEEYKNVDKKRRALDYLIRNREVGKLSTKINRASAQQDRLNKELNDAEMFVQNKENQISSVAQENESLQKQIILYKAQQDYITEELEAMIKEKSSSEIKLEVLQTHRQETAQNEIEKRELQNLEKAIVGISEDIKTAVSHCETLQRKEKVLDSELQSKKEELKALHLKNAETHGVVDSESHAQWIRGELESLETCKNEKQQQIQELVTEIKQNDIEAENISKTIQKLQREGKDCKEAIKKQQQEFHDLKAESRFLVTNRSYLWQNEVTAIGDISFARHEIEAANNLLSSKLEKSTCMGLKSVKKVLEKLQEDGELDVIDGYYGLLIDNIDFRKGNENVLESAAGDRMFHHIVVSDRIATRILKMMSEMKLPGSASFLPMNRIVFRPKEFTESQDWFPIQKILTFDTKFRNVVEFVFGNVLFCRSLENGIHVARSFHMTAVLSSGDKVSSNGSVTGGFRRPSTTSIAIYAKMKKAIKDSEDCQDVWRSVKAKLQACEEDINRNRSELQKLEARLKAKREEMAVKMKMGARLEESKLEGLKEASGRLEELLEDRQRSLKLLEHREKLLRDEITWSVSSQELPAAIHELQQHITNLEKSQTQAFTQMNVLRENKRRRENLLHLNLKKRKQDLDEKIQSTSEENESLQVLEHEAIIEENKKSIEEMQAELEVVNAEMNRLKDLKQTNDSKLVELQNVLIVAVDERNKSFEAFYNSREEYSYLKEKYNDWCRNRTFLETVPADLSPYADKSTPWLISRLENVHEELKKKYKTMDFVAISKLLKETHWTRSVMKRWEDAMQMNGELSELLNSSDEMTKMILESASKEIKENFKTYFQKFVPNGFGELVLTSQSNGDSVTGIEIRVSFLGNRNLLQNVSQLSGGQKTVVALSFMFALQMHNPSPFYILDEVDQALDPKYRKALAEIVQEMSSKAQFIISTFQHELLPKSQRIFNVECRNGTSYIQEIDRKAARELLKKKRKEDREEKQSLQ